MRPLYSWLSPPDGTSVSGYTAISVIRLSSVTAPWPGVNIAVNWPVQRETELYLPVAINNRKDTSGTHIFVAWCRCATPRGRTSGSVNAVITWCIGLCASHVTRWSVARDFDFIDVKLNWKINLVGARGVRGRCTELPPSGRVQCASHFDMTDIVGYICLRLIANSHVHYAYRRFFIYLIKTTRYMKWKQFKNNDSIRRQLYLW